MDWTTDGRSIAVGVHGYGSGNGIYVMNADGTGVNFVVKNEISSPAPAWRPAYAG
jgi:hypothetical protein